MSLFLITLRALAPLFLLIVLGYGLKRARLLHASHVPILNGLVVNVTLPALIVMGSGDRAAAAARGAATAARPAGGAGGDDGAGLGPSGRLGRFPPPVRGALLVVGAFGNTGFLGYPMTLALHPAQFPAAILLDQFGMTIALYLCAPLIGARLGIGGRARGTARGRRRCDFCARRCFCRLWPGSAARLIPWPPALLQRRPLPATSGMSSGSA